MLPIAANLGPRSSLQEFCVTQYEAIIGSIEHCWAKGRFGIISLLSD